IFTQLTGINVVLQYAPVILKNAGFQSNFTSMLGSVIIGLLNFLSTIAATFMIDNFGRRPLLLSGLMGILLTEIFLGTLTCFNLNAQWSGILSLGGLFVFVIFFAIGPGVAIWL